MNPSSTAAWAIREADFPAAASLSEQLRFLVGYAILAPSGHNTQPWRFRVGAGHLDVLADRSRALQVVDPYDRELLISCAAALECFVVAAHYFSLAVRVDCTLDPADPDRIARLHVGAGAAPSDTDSALFKAIVARRTHRVAFDMAPLPPEFARHAHSMAAALGIELKLLESLSARAAIADLVAEGDHLQFNDPRFRRELATWVRSKQLGSHDGLSGASFGMPDVLSGVGRLVIRTFDIGDGMAAADQAKILSGSAALLVIASDENPHGWIHSGRTLARISLWATSLGLSVSYLNQPIEMPTLRPELQAAAGVTGVPQLLLRIGHADSIPEPSARRPVAEVMVGD